MNKRILGKTDLAISPIVFGGNVFGWTIDQNESFEILDEFMANGFNCIDTANSYSHWKPGNKGGESETIIGNWLKRRQRRDDVIIATKVGSSIGGQGNRLNTTYIISEVEQSLKRLQTDYIDLYFSHYDDESISVEEPLAAYEKLIKEGKVRWIGASNFSPERLLESLKAAEANNLPQYQVYQPGYNLFDRSEFESAHLPICKAYNLGVVPYYSLASGFLTGKYRNASDLQKSQRGAGVTKYLTERGLKILNALDQLAGNHGVEPAAIALAWLLHQSAVTAPIASVTNLAQLKVFPSAVELNLTNTELDLLNNASNE
jgi:aryl-alcohol dehydrogenase-like predicted oxidoreductase